MKKIGIFMNEPIIVKDDSQVDFIKKKLESYLSEKKGHIRSLGKWIRRHKKIGELL